ncbi:MAG: hydrogenase iron-sulfur subunit [Chloroflexi bacterium]|nr:hydrogenase iron-sulfur subunit [Chloroflexota bacterium]MBK8935738.1 hydrogenase iron-sulfur subunit [Chloroflexota bacterium]
MAVETVKCDFKILILATISGGYAGADSVGQLHTDYPANVYVLPVVCPAMFPEDFYLRTFERGIDAILVMYSGTDCPYKGGAERTAVIINHVYPLMETRGIDTRRLRLAAICTVCTKPFLNEVIQMNHVLQEIGPVRQKRNVPVPV